MKVEIEIPDDLYNKIKLLCQILDQQVEKKIAQFVKEEIGKLINEIKENF